MNKRLCLVPVQGMINLAAMLNNTHVCVQEYAWLHVWMTPSKVHLLEKSQDMTKVRGLRLTVVVS